MLLKKLAEVVRIIKEWMLSFMGSGEFKDWGIWSGTSVDHIIIAAINKVRIQILQV